MLINPYQARTLLAIIGNEADHNDYFASVNPTEGGGSIIVTVSGRNFYIDAAGNEYTPRSTRRTREFKDPVVPYYGD